MRIFLTALLLIVSAAMTTAQEPEAPAEPELITMKLGEFWYGMYTPDGEPEGYARINLAETSQGGVHCDWELHIAGEGWTYEEEREITFDEDWRLTWTRIHDGNRRIAAARAGDEMVGKSGVNDLRVEVSDDAITGMGFILPAAMELKPGVELERTEYNEAADLKDIGTTTLTVGEREVIEIPEGKVEATRVEMQRSEEGPAIPVWVNDDREIVQIDWGSGNLMKLHREETTHMFAPAPPTLTEVEPDDKTKLVLTADFEGFTLEEMWDHWATAEGLTKWWPPEAEIGNEKGDPYIATWKNDEGEIRWQLQGEIEIWEPHERLGFSWRWNITPDGTPDLHVVVDFEVSDNGVKVTIIHSEFEEDPDSQTNRQGLHDGWEQFCTKLATLKK